MFFWWRKWWGLLHFLGLLFWVFSVARANNECKKATCQAPLRYSHTGFSFHVIPCNSQQVGVETLTLNPIARVNYLPGSWAAVIQVYYHTAWLIAAGCSGFCNSSPEATALRHLIEQFFAKPFCCSYERESSYVHVPFAPQYGTLFFSFFCTNVTWKTRPLFYRVYLLGSCWNLRLSQSYW